MPPWKPTVFYNKEGDLLEIYLSSVSHYAKWISPGISLLLSQDNNEIVGVQIENLSKVENIKDIVKFINLA